MAMFTPWAWDPAPTAVTVTAHERLLRADTITTSFGLVNYWVYGAYDLTTTIRTVEISFPQAMTAITAAMPTARLVSTSNGDAELPTRWNGALRYVGSLRLRVEVDYPIPVVGGRRRDSFTPDAIPFASRSEQQVSVDRNVRLSLPGDQLMWPEGDTATRQLIYDEHVRWNVGDFGPGHLVLSAAGVLSFALEPTSTTSGARPSTIRLRWTLRDTLRSSTDVASRHASRS
jgi:hypothetical protein